MKRISLALVFFYCCTFCVPRPAVAIAPAIVAAAAVGAAMLSTSAGQYYVQNGTMPAYVSTSIGAVASGLDKMFQPAYLAVGPLSLVTVASFPAASSVYIAKNAALGMTIDSIWQTVKESAAGYYNDLKSLFQTYEQPANTYSSLNPYESGFILPDNRGILNILSFNGSSAPWELFGNPGTLEVACSYASGCNSLVKSGGATVFWGGTPGSTSNTGPWLLIPRVGGGYQLFHWRGGYTPYGGPDPNTTVAGALDYPGLKTALMAPTAAVANDVRNVIRAAPPGQLTQAAAVPATTAQTVPPTALSPEQVNNILKGNTAEVAQKAAELAAAAAAANPNDAAAQVAAAQAAAEAAKAAQEAADNTPPAETFSPVGVSSFGQPYNPGAFDIPARFTTFVNRVKASPLFSFSNGFFSSLPGGGSPIYEIDAGQYGHHTIDLSQTMSTGLAVLKTILLACFGFLSIRAVIMKR